MRISASLKNIFVIYLILLISAVLYPLHSAAGDKTSYTLAVPTQLSPVAMHKSWSPFAERLSKEIGVTIQLKVYNTIAQYTTDVMKGVPDFAFLNPYLVVATKNNQGYIPLIRDKNPLIGILVVHKDSPINSITDLNNKEIIFPTPNAFSASLYMRALLREKERVNFTPRYVTSHGNVYRNVILGKVSVGSGSNKTLGSETPEVRSQLRVIYETPESAPHPLSAHPRVPQKLRRAVIDAVLRLAGDKRNSRILNAIHMPEPVRADYQKDYLYLEKLKLNKYFVAGEE